jgi:hypothetical protein
VFLKNLSSLATTSCSLKRKNVNQKNKDKTKNSVSSATGRQRRWETIPYKIVSMETTTIAGVQVSRIGLGTWEIGGTEWGAVPDDVAIATCLGALERGINLIDTAPHSVPPISHVPRPMRETCTPAIVVVSMETIL